MSKTAQTNKNTTNRRYRLEWENGVRFGRVIAVENKPDAEEDKPTD